jgi:hypothetical protein
MACWQKGQIARISHGSHQIELPLPVAAIGPYEPPHDGRDHLSLDEKHQRMRRDVHLYAHMLLIDGIDKDKLGEGNGRI